MADYKRSKVFEALLPAQSPEELELLNKDMQLNGILSPFIVWRETKILLDGHTRDRINKDKRYGFKPKLKFLSFKTEEEAKAWVIQHQLARRRMTDEQRTYWIGQLYLLRKQPHGGQKAAAEKGMSHGETSLSTAEQVAGETGLSRATVMRAAAFAEQVNSAPTEDKAAILAGEKELPKKPPRTIAGATKKPGSVTLDMEKLNHPCGMIERFLDQLCRAYGMVHPHADTVKESMEIAGSRRAFRAWKKDLEKEIAALRSRN